MYDNCQRAGGRCEPGRGSRPGRLEAASRNRLPSVSFAVWSPLTGRKRMLKEVLYGLALVSIRVVPREHSRPYLNRTGFFIFYGRSIRSGLRPAGERCAGVTEGCEPRFIKTEPAAMGEASGPRPGFFSKLPVSNRKRSGHQDDERNSRTS